MDTWPLVGAASFAVATVAVPLARNWAIRTGFMDVPNERSSHAVPKPRIGGAGIMLGATAGLVTSALLSGDWQSLPLFLIVILFSVGGVGLLDDVVQLSVGKRMSLYLLGAFLVALLCHRIGTLELPLIPPYAFGTTGAIVFTTLFIGWYTNLFNFMDGTDGIAAGAAIVTCCALAFVFLSNDDAVLGHVSLSLAGATLGFLIYNFSPASVFMGDVGSVFLGTGCGALTAAAIERQHVSLVAGVLLMFPFVFDATFTLVRRGLHGERVWLAHRSHIYQQMCDLGVSHRSVSLSYTAAAAACAGAGLAYDDVAHPGQLSIVGALLAAGFGTAAAVLAINARRQL